MARTFVDELGRKINLDSLLNEYRVEVECDLDIVTNEPSGYAVLLDGEETYNVSKDVYEALKAILG